MRSHCFSVGFILTGLLFFGLYHDWKTKILIFKTRYIYISIYTPFSCCFFERIGSQPDLVVKTGAELAGANELAWRATGAWRVMRFQPIKKGEIVGENQRRLLMSKVLWWLNTKEKMPQWLCWILNNQQSCTYDVILRPKHKESVAKGKKKAKHKDLHLKRWPTTAAIVVKGLSQLKAGWTNISVNQKPVRKKISLLSYLTQRPYGRTDLMPP